MKFSEFKYERIDLEQVCRQYQQLLDELSMQKHPQDFYRVFSRIQKLSSHVATMETICSIRHSVNTNDEFYQKEKDFWDEAYPQLKVYEDRLAAISLDFNDRKGLLEFIPETYFLKAECLRKSFDEKIIPLMQQENKLTSEYGRLKASAQIEFEGKTYNLSSITPLIESSDRALRRRAYDAKMDFYRRNQQRFDQIYDQLVKVRTEMAHQLGYETYTQLAYYIMMRLDYNREMVAAYRRQILEDLVPLCRKLYADQAKRIGVDKLQYYDLSYEFADGNPKPSSDSDELVKAAISMYHKMSRQTGEFIDLMNDGQLWDLISRDGKEMGGYTTMLADYKVPFIFANFNGTSGDVDVLTHEAGHAFQFYCSRDVEVQDCLVPTMESAEIHSMSMEFFAYPWMESFFGKDCKKYYYSHFTGCLKFLPYGVLVDHFQHEIYDHPQMSIAERKATWRKLEKMYCPDRNFDGCDILEEGCWWYQQGHIFESPFYYIDYTLAQICALQFWARCYRHDESAFDDYLHLCSLGGTMPFTSLVREAGLKVPFEDGCVKEVVDTAREYLKSF